MSTVTRDYERGARSRLQLVGHGVARELPRFAVIGLLAVMLIVFSALRPESFGTSNNYKTMLFSNADLVILALAAMIPLVAKEFDLSIASMMGLASMLAAGLYGNQGIPGAFVILILLGLGVAVGGIHALLIVRFGLPSFIVTLGTGSVMAAFTLQYSGGEVIFGQVASEITNIASVAVLGIRWPVFIMLLAAGALWFMLEQRPWGRYLYAIGSNEDAARLAGVATGRVRMSALVLASTLAAFAGILLTARIGSGYPTIAQSFFLPAFAAAFLSVSVFRLGVYNAWGVVVSVYLLAVGVTGLKALGAPFWVEPLFNGVALVVAVGLSRLRVLTRTHEE